MKKDATQRATSKPSCAEERRYLYSTRAVEGRISADRKWNTKPRAFKVRYIVDAIVRQRLGMARVIKSRSKPVNLHNKALKGAIGNDYREVLQWLMDTGLVGTDGTWRVGEKATGYYLTKRGWRGGIVPVEMDATQAARWTQARARLKRETDKKRRDEGVPLDYLRFHLGKLSWPEGAVEEHFKRLPPVTKWQEAAKVEAHQYAVGLVRSRDWTFHRCAAGRLHYPLTNIPGALRRQLEYDGEGLVQIDVSSCQPFLAEMLYDEIPWTGLPETIAEERARYLADLKGPDFYRRIAEVAVEGITQRWRELDNEMRRDRERWGRWSVDSLICEMNDLHEERLKISAMLEKGDLKAIKRTVLKDVFFGGHNQWNSTLALYGFGNLYGNLYWHLGCRKVAMAPTFKNSDERNYWKGDRDLAIRLQGAEARIVIDGALARVARELPEVPAFPVHDCLMTVERHVEAVRRIMAEEFQAAMGEAPSFKVEAVEVEERKKA